MFSAVTRSVTKAKTAVSKFVVIAISYFFIKFLFKFAIADEALEGSLVSTVFGAGFAFTGAGFELALYPAIKASLVLLLAVSSSTLFESSFTFSIKAVIVVSASAKSSAFALVSV